MMRTLLPAILIATANLAARSVGAVPAEVQEIERLRVATIEEVTPCVVAVMEPGGDGGGSGVLVSPTGLALTNFHVVAPCGATMICGLPDGRTYDAELVGLDPTGDIAVIQLAGRDNFPAARIGDSDQVRIGDEAIVLGNPFLLATDFRPSVSCGIVSGVGRYQYPADTILEYADCLQTDAAINPGNSGGPLFDSSGELIGINGRASFGERGRVNVGVGYAVSINQAMRFLPQMRVGRIVDHASLEATAVTLAGAAVIDQVEPRSAAARAGLRSGDRVVAIDGRPIHSANSLKNAIGVYPAGWVVAIDIKRGGESHSMRVRLASRHAEGELIGAVTRQARPTPAGGQKTPSLNLALGLANSSINERELQRLLGRRSSPREAGSPWEIGGEDSQGKPVVLLLGAGHSSLEVDRGKFFVEPARPMDVQDAPPGSGGLLVGFDLLRRLLLREPLDRSVAWGQTPWPIPEELCDAVHVEHGGAVAQFYFDRQSSSLLGFEVWLGPTRPPCVVRLDRDASEPALRAHIENADGSVSTWRIDKQSPLGWLEANPDRKE
ncbi:Periplasmic serine endoprotease DegP precursor [Pirellulimonas nuda]|uniref:Periplasmic serine endoprotease DegP n=1 Tax=Pirellulimonas nuda TaxID=2528009 RepID=A0A518DB78_9BACT|nr:trypsin-like peptidase domain-containing protein [Pirellulimonas nuda]QDU88739.1 Periplasmic serine endoprotease DegP precursor [Pirellulimonas nuda]